MKKPKQDKLKLRVSHIPRVYRLIPLNVMPKIDTIFGESSIVLSKVCKNCRVNHPLGNYFPKSKSKRSGQTAEELTGSDMESVCIHCWDARKKKRKETNKSIDSLIEFFIDG